MKTIRKDFNPAKRYSVAVSNCTDETKREVQQAFFDAGFQWKSGGEGYQYLEAASYTNTTDRMDVTTHLMYSCNTKDCNMTAKEFLELVYEPEQQGCVHAESMALYAEDAKTHTEPWKLWQFTGVDGAWLSCDTHPMWILTTKYRRKPKTHIVNGVEVPDLRIKPENGQEYWFPSASISSYVLLGCIYKVKSPSCIHRLENNLCYEYSDEGRQAAIEHAKAWLGV